MRHHGTGAGKAGGIIAFLLGLFCRFYKILPRNINFVWYNCERCNSDSKCGHLSKCGERYGCGNGVTRPLEPNFNVYMIPKIRKKILEEKLNVAAKVTDIGS